MLYLQPTFPLIVYSWHEASAVYIKRASPRAGAELNIQVGLTLASAVAPLFVRGDNILSSPSVRWTVSWIPLTPRISISVNVADNLDVCRCCAARASTGREKKRAPSWSVASPQHCLSRTCQGFQGDFNVKYLLRVLLFSDILISTHTCIHTSITATDWKADKIPGKCYKASAFVRIQTRERRRAKCRRETRQGITEEEMEICVLARACDSESPQRGIPPKGKG